MEWTQDAFPGLSPGSTRGPQLEQGQGPVLGMAMRTRDRMFTRRRPGHTGPGQASQAPLAVTAPGAGGSSPSGRVGVRPGATCARRKPSLRILTLPAPGGSSRSALSFHVKNHEGNFRALEGGTQYQVASLLGQSNVCFTKMQKPPRQQERKPMLTLPSGPRKEGTRLPPLGLGTET